MVTLPAEISSSPAIARKRGFATARRPHEYGEFAVSNIQCYAMQRLRRPVELVHTLQPDFGHMLVFPNVTYFADRPFFQLTRANAYTFLCAALQMYVNH